MAAPRTFGTLDPIRRIVTASGPARTLWIGDSISGASTDGMMQALLRTWRPAIFSGLGLMAGANAGDAGFSFDNTVRDGGASLCGTTTLYDGTQNVNSIGKFCWSKANTKYGAYTTFNGTAAPADLNDYWCRIAEFGLIGNTAIHPNRKWFNNKALTFDYFHVANSLGIQSFRLRVRTRSGGAGTSYGIQTGFSSRNATPTVTKSSISIAARSYAFDGTDEPYLSIQPPASGATTNGENLVHAAMRVSTGENGFELTPYGIGTSTSTEWASTMAPTQSYLNSLATGLGWNITCILLGQNDGGSLTKAQYKSNILAIMAMLLTANPSMQFILLSPYQTAPASWSASGLGNSSEPYADALYEIAQSMSAQVFFLNLRQILGGDLGATEGYNFLNAEVLSDSVHPTTPAGNYYIMGKMWGEMIRVLSTSPSVMRGRTRFSQLGLSATGG